VLETLCLIEAEVAESLEPHLDHHVAHLRLAWWREECERYAKGEPLHPLTRQLTALSVPAAGLGGLIDAATWDLARATFETRREMRAYCERWAEALIEPAVAHALAQSAIGADPSSWRAAGAALREIELLANLEREAHSGRLRWPLDELDRAGTPPEALAAPPWPRGLVTQLRARHEALRGELAATTADLEPDLQPTLRGLLAWVSLAAQLSRAAQAALPRSLPAHRTHALAGSWIAWRAARAAQNRRYRME
jgi:phytoene synthase